MKLIGCEFAFDGKKIVFFFTSDGRVDFRELVKVLAGKFKLRIELRQIGIRDETKILGGIAPCGRTCCCASCMSDFGKVSIKMAKNQGLHLNPGKISGLCGRLMCCLEYENDYYAEVYKKMPKVGGTVGTPEGNGIVVSNDMLKVISKVKITKGDGSEVYKDFPVSELDFKRAKQDADDDTDKIDEDIKKILD
jgi:cell fate regulator YaaT (PSP1 superfamily)